jgi:hypothetical protein
MNMPGSVATDLYVCQYTVYCDLPLHIFEISRQVVDLIGCAREKVIEKGTWCRTRVAELAMHRCTGFRLATTGRLVPWQLAGMVYS